MIKQIEKDVEEVLSDRTIPWHKLHGKTVLVTGATGLLGKLVVKTLIGLKEKDSTLCNVIALVRNKDKANIIFEKEKEKYDQPEVIVSDIKNVGRIDKKIDYIIHAAGETSSRSFVEKPVEVTETAVIGTDNILKIAKDHSVEGMIYLSSMEVYGAPEDDRKISEDTSLTINPSVVRNSYPIGKILCESLCVSYATEYKVPVDIIRLTQTFGAGVDHNDTRVFAEFARCAVEGRDIVLKTKGETKRSYLYTTDAIRAVFTVMLRDRTQGIECKAEVYNAANENTYCSIADMAKLVTEISGHKKIDVKYELSEDIEKMGYGPTLCMNLDTGRLQGLGWKPAVGLAEMYRRLFRDLSKGAK